MKKILALLITGLPDHSFSAAVTLPRGAKSHIKNVLGLALYFYYLVDTNSTYVLNWNCFKRFSKKRQNYNIVINCYRS